MAIKNTYVKDNIKDFLGVMPVPCPTIKPVNIGIIGKTQGVNDNNKPAKRKRKIL
tara:strand:+ start:666 stop:830 length:165 start_codon:yes stop_codon:yes gene_type:complete